VATEERIVLTAELKDELSAPLRQVERRVQASTRRMARDAERQNRSVSQNLRRIATSVQRTFTTSSNGLRRIATSVGTGWRRMFSGVGGGATRAAGVIRGAFDRVGPALGRVAQGVRNGFTRAFTFLSSAASRATAGIGRAFSGLGAAMARTTAKMTSVFGSAMTKMQTLAKNAMSGINGVITAAAGALTLGAGAVLTQAMTTGLDRAKVVQDTVASGKILLGNEEQALELVTKLKEVVTGTPFSLPDFAKAGMDMVAFGVEAEKVPGIMRAIGEAAAGRGEGAVEAARSLALNMAQMSAVGKVSMDDIWSFTGVGVDALGILGNYFGETTEDMQKLISEGTIPADKAIEVLTDGIMNGTTGAAGTTKALEGSMAALRQTVSGSWGALKAGIAKMGTQFWDPLQTGNSGVMGQLPTLFNALNKLASAFGEKVFKPLGLWVEKMGFIPKLTAFVERMTAALTAKGDGGILASLKENAPALGVFAGLLVGFMGMALSKLPLIGGMFKFINIPLGIFLGLLATSPELRGGLADALKEIWVGLQSMGESLKPLLPMFTEMATILAHELTNVLKTLVPVIVGLMPVFAQVLKDVGGALLGLVQLLAPLIAQLIGQLAPVIGDLIRQLLPVFSTILTTLASVVGQLLAAILPLVVQLISILAPVIGQLITDLLPVFVELLTSLADIVTEVLTAFGPLVVQLVKLLAPILTQLAKTLLPIFTDLIKQLAPIVVNLIKEIAPLIAQLLTGLAPIIGELTSTLLPIIADLLKTLAPIVTKLLTAFGPLIVKLLTGLLPLLLKLIELVLPILMDLFTELAPLVMDLLDAFIPLIDPIANILGMFIDLIITVLEPLIPLIVDLAKVFADNLKEDLKWLIPVIEEVVKWLGEVLKWAQGPIGDLLKGIGETLKGIFEGFNAGGEVDVNGNVILNTPGGLNGPGIEDVPIAAGGAIAGWNRAAGGTILPGFGPAVLPGYAPGHDSIPYLLSPGESVLVPELTRQIGPENIMAANHAASHGRPAGDGPMRKAGGGTTITVADGAVRLTFQGTADYAEVKRAARDALNEVLERQKREY
jgi:tape measure domain-containing protein